MDSLTKHTHIHQSDIISTFAMIIKTLGYNISVIQQRISKCSPIRHNVGLFLNGWKKDVRRGTNQETWKIVLMGLEAETQ